MVTLFGRETGKLGAIARAARRSRKRFGAALAPFVLGEAELKERRGDLWQLLRFDAIRDFPTIATDVAKLGHASYLTELCRELLPERAPDSRIFDLYARALELLDAGPPSLPLLRAYELHLLDAVGLRPMLGACVRCAAAGPAAGFDPAAGMLCEACAAAGALALGEATRQDLLGRQGQSFDEAAARPIDPEVNAQARRALVAFVEWHLGRRLKSVEVIAQMSQR